jgi:hypothetical protein
LARVRSFRRFPSSPHPNFCLPRSSAAVSSRRFSRHGSYRVFGPVMGVVEGTTTGHAASISGRQSGYPECRLSQLELRTSPGPRTQRVLSHHYRPHDWSYSSRSTPVCHVHGVRGVVQVGPGRYGCAQGDARFLCHFVGINLPGEEASPVPYFLFQ